VRPLTEDLLELAASPAFGGPEAVVAAIGKVLGDVAPFRFGEVVATTGGDWRRWPMGAPAEPVAGEELLEWLGGRDSVLRVDDPGELPLRLTREVLAARGLRSLLAYPFRGAGSVRGAVILYDEQGWGFAGVATRRVAAIGAMAGHCLWSALRVEEAQGEAERLREALGMRSYRRPEGASG
jgi:hypothetical protein